MSGCTESFAVTALPQARGLLPDAVTFGALMEACIQGKRPDLALRLFDRATSEVGALAHSCRVHQ